MAKNGKNVMVNSEKIIRVGVGVFILNPKNEVLLLHRISTHANGTWAPPGGYIEFGESFKEASKRELKEELDLDIDDVEIVGVCNNVYPEEGKHVIAIEVKAHQFAGEPKLMEPEKHSEFRWFSLNNLPEPMMPSTKQFLDSNPACLCGSGIKLKACHGK